MSMVDYDYNLNFIGNNFTNDSVVKVTLSLTDNNSNNISNTKVYLTSENGEVLTSYTDDNGLVEFNVTKTGKWTASTDLTGCNTTYRTITVNHTVNSLYNAFMSLINQRYYNKNEIQDLIPSVKDSGVYDGVIYISYDNQEDLTLSFGEDNINTINNRSTNNIFTNDDDGNVEIISTLTDENNNGIEGVIISLIDEEDNVLGKNVTNNNGVSVIDFDIGNNDTKSVKCITKNIESNTETVYNKYKDTNIFKCKVLWFDSDNIKNKRPSSVTVRINRDGEEIDSFTLNEANNWSAKKESILENEYGHEYEYGWSEDGVGLYYTHSDVIDNLTIISNILIDANAPPTPTDDDDDGETPPPTGEFPTVPPLPEDIPERPRS